MVEFFLIGVKMFVLKMLGRLKRRQIEIHCEGIEPKFNLLPRLFAEFEKFNFLFEGELTAHSY